MTAVASAPDNSRASTSAGPYQTVYEQRSAVAKAAEAAAREEVESGDGNRDLGFCQPALAATITRDAERLCEQQRKRTSRAMEIALAGVAKAERAAESETVRHQLRLHGDDDNYTRERTWTPHTKKSNKQPPELRKAKVGRAIELANTPPWAKELNEMKRSVSWATALESTLDDEPSPFPPVVPLSPPPPVPARKVSIASAVLAAVAESPSTPPPTGPEARESGGGGSSEIGPVVIDDDWVVRKLAQIRRRSRNIDSATGVMPGVQQGRAGTGYSEKMSQATSSSSSAAAAAAAVPGIDLNNSPPSAPPVRLGGMVMLQPLFQRTTHGVENLDADSSDDRRLSPLLPPPAGQTPSHSSFPLPLEASGGQHQHEDHNDHDPGGDETQRAAERAMVMMMPTTSPVEPGHIGPKARLTAASNSYSGTQANEEDHHDGHGDTVGTQVGGSAHDGQSSRPVTGGGDSTNASRDEHSSGGGSASASVSASTTAGERGAQTETNGEASASPQQQEQQYRPGMNHQHEEPGGRVLHEVSPEERAVSLPSSSVLATDGSGDLRRRGIRWESMGPVLGGGGDDGDGGDGGDDGRGAVGGRGNVWLKRWKQKEEEEAKAKEEAKAAKEKRAKMVLEVLARSEHIFRCNAERRRRKSADYGVETWLKERASTGGPEAKAAEAAAAHGRGAVTARRGRRPNTSPMPRSFNPHSEKSNNIVIINNNNNNNKRHGDVKNNADDDDNNDDDNTGKPSKPSLKRQLSAYIRGKTASSLPCLNAGCEGGDDSNASLPDVIDGEDQGKSITATAEVEGAAAADQGETSEEPGRGEIGVILAAKRVATRKRQERAEKEARVQEEAAKRESRRAFEEGLRSIVAKPSSVSSRSGGVGRYGGKPSANRRRSSAPSSPSCLSSASPSGLSLGSFDGAIDGACDTAPPAGGGNSRSSSGSRDLYVRVRVPVAAKEETPRPRPMTTTSGEGSSRGAPNVEVANGDKCDGDKIHGPRLNPGPTPILSPDMTADRTPVIAKTTGRPKPDGGGKHQREKEEKEGVGEEEASPQQEEQHRKRQESIASSEAGGRCYRTSERRRRSTQQWELDARRQLEQLEEISLQGAQRRASARSTAYYRIITKTPAARSAARTRDGGKPGGVTVVRGGDGASSSVGTRRQRRISSSADRVHRQQRPVQRRDGAEKILAALDPGVRRRSSPARVGRMTPKRFEELATIDGLAGRSPEYSGAGLGSPSPSQPQQQQQQPRQQKPLGLRERKKRRRKRQQQRSRRKELLRSDFLSSRHDNNGGDDDDCGGGSSGDYDNTGWPAGEHIQATTDPPGHVKQAVDRNTRHNSNYPQGSNENNSNGVKDDGNKGEERGRPTTLASTTADRKAQRKPLGAEPDEGQVDKKKREVIFKHVARKRSQHNVPRRRRDSSDADTSGSRTEETVKAMGPGSGSEPPRVGQAGAGGNDGGGVEDRGKGFESRAAAAGESRFRRTRRKKSLEFKKRGSGSGSGSGGGGGGNGGGGGGGGSGGAVVPGRSDNDTVVHPDDETETGTNVRAGVIITSSESAPNLREERAQTRRLDEEQPILHKQQGQFVDVNEDGDGRRDGGSCEGGDNDDSRRDPEGGGGSPQTSGVAEQEGWEGEEEEEEEEASSIKALVEILEGAEPLDRTRYGCEEGDADVHADADSTDSFCRFIARGAEDEPEEHEVQVLNTGDSSDGGGDDARCSSENTSSGRLFHGHFSGHDYWVGQAVDGQETQARERRDSVDGSIHTLYRIVEEHGDEGGDADNGGGR